MQSFRQLYADYSKDIYYFLFKITGYEQILAEELTQETFYQAFISISKFEGKCQIKTWLCQIAKNMYYQHLRKMKREHSMLKSMSENEPLKDVTLSPQIQLENAELIRDALAIINSFDNKMRDVMLYRLYSDMPYSQISLLLKISESSAKVLFFRGKVALQTRLREDLRYEI